MKFPFPFIYRYSELKEQHYKDNVLCHLTKQFRNTGLEPQFENVTSEYQGIKAIRIKSVYGCDL